MGTGGGPGSLLRCNIPVAEGQAVHHREANQCLKKLEKEGLLRLEYGGVTIVDLERLRSYGE